MSAMSESKDKLAVFENTLEQKFKRLAEDTCRLLRTEGLDVVAFQEGLPFFKKMNLLGQSKVTEQLEFFHKLCSEQINENYEIKDNHSFVWRAMRALGLAPTSDLLNYITDDNIVEIHSSDNLQLFRNFKFFEYCSYSLEEIYCIEWWNLYRRDEQSLKELVEIATQVYSGGNLAGLKPLINAHTVSEISSAEKLTLTVSYDWVAPVFQNKRIAGCVSVARAQMTSN
jgi:hypothetical protein